MIVRNARASPSHATSPQLGWFFAWAAVGVGTALAISMLGVFAAPLALCVAIVLIVRHHVGRSTFGILVGMGLLFLYVAYVQRQGPGTVYWHTATESGAETYLDPRPWLAAGLLLVVAGVAGFLWSGRRGAWSGSTRRHTR
jgi:hypothetical protein